MKLIELFESKSSDDDHKYGTFGCLEVDLEQAQEIAEWCDENDVPCQDKDKLHCTVIYSPKPCPELMKFDESEWNIMAKVTGYKILGTSLVLILDCPEVIKLHETIMENSDATYTWPDYIPHVSLFYAEPDEEINIPDALPCKEIKLSLLHFEPLTKSE